MTRIKKPSIAKLKKILWAKLKEAVHLRDGDICLTCGERQGYAVCHILPQSNCGILLRYDLDNVYWGCRGCNNDEQWHRGDWREPEGVFERIFGKEHMANLRAKRDAAKLRMAQGKPDQMRRPDYEDKIAELQAYINDL